MSTVSSPPPTPKLHLLVQHNLSWSQKVVQAAHATDAWRSQFAPVAATTLPIVVYRVAAADLPHWQARLAARGAVAFREPDLDDEITAIAYCGNPLPEFRDLQLL